MRSRERYHNPFDCSEPWALHNRLRRDTTTGSSSASGTSTSMPNIPGFLEPLISQMEGQLGTLGQQSGPGLLSQLNPNPEQIAPLTPEENAIIGSLTQEGSPNNPLITGAENQISQLTSGPIGSSPATQAAMNAYNTTQVPETEQTLALSGSGRGGGDTEALTSAREAAYTPLVQQEIANRQTAASQFASLAGEQSQLGQTALSAAEMPQEVRQAQYEAAYQDLLRRYGLEQEATIDPFEGILGSLIGQTTTGTNSGATSTTPSGLSSGLGAAEGITSILGDLFG